MMGWDYELRRNSVAGSTCQLWVDSDVRALFCLKKNAKVNIWKFHIHIYMYTLPVLNTYLLLNVI